jgi:hypothetical protein
MNNKRIITLKVFSAALIPFVIWGCGKEPSSDTNITATPPTSQTPGKQGTNVEPTAPAAAVAPPIAAKVEQNRPQESPPVETKKPEAKFDLSGSWNLDAAYPDSGISSMVFQLDLQQKESTIGGTVSGGRPVSGSIEGAKVSLTVNYEASIPGGINVYYEGNALDKDTIKGTVNFPGRGAGTWTAKRR